MNDRAWLSSAGCRQGWAAPIPDPQRPPEEAESPNHRPGPTDPASPHCPHLTSLSALRPPPAAPGCPLSADSAAPASGLPLCVPGPTPAHVPRPPETPRPQSQPLPAAAGLPRGARPCLPVGSCTWRHRPWPLSGIIRQGLCLPRGTDRRWARGGEVQPHAPPAPPPRASLSAYRAAPSHRASGAPGSLPSHHPLSWGPRCPRHPVLQSGVPWSLAPGQPSLCSSGAPWRVRRGGRLAWALQPLQCQPVRARACECPGFLRCLVSEIISRKLLYIYIFW